MAKHLNPLEKEFLIRKFKGNSKVKLGDFCRANNVSETSFKKWLKQYEEAGIEGWLVLMLRLGTYFLRALTKPRRGISEKSYACVLRMNGSKKNIW